jgi:hypothetical protein
VELRLDATKPYVLVTDVPMGHVSLVFHDYSRTYAGSVKTEVFGPDNKPVMTGSLKDSQARYTAVHDAPGRYITRLTPVDVEPGAEIRAVATTWKDPGLTVDDGTYTHTPDRFGSGLVIPVTVSDPLPWTWMSATVVDNVVDVYSGSANLSVMHPDGTMGESKSFGTDRDLSIRFATPEPGLYLSFATLMGPPGGHGEGTTSGGLPVVVRASSAA